MSVDAEPAPDPHDHLVQFVFSRPQAIAIVLRRVLSPALLVALDLDSLALAPTVHTNPWLRSRVSDLCFTVDALDGGRRIKIYLSIEHRSTPDPCMPWRALVYAGEFWDRYIRDRPKRPRKIPFVLPILLAQHPARNTPVQLSKILDVSPGLRSVLGAPIAVSLHVDDFSGSILGDRKAPRATRALVELARALLHAYKNPGSLTKQRMASLAPQFDILLERRRPDDVAALWVYVISVFEVDSPLRDIIVKSVSKAAREMYMTLKDHLLAEGQKIGQKIGEAKGQAEGRAIGKAQALIGVLEHRGLSISGAVRKRVLASRDEIELQRWFDRAFTVASAEELFEPRRAIGTPSRPSRRARRPVALQSANGGARARSL